MLARWPTDPFGIVPSALVTIGTTLVLTFHSFLNSLARSVIVIVIIVIIIIINIIIIIICIIVVVACSYQSYKIFNPLNSNFKSELSFVATIYTCPMKIYEHVFFFFKHGEI